MIQIDIKCGSSFYMMGVYIFIIHYYSHKRNKFVAEELKILLLCHYFFGNSLSNALKLFDI